MLSLFHLFQALDDCDCVGRRIILKKCRVSKFMKLKYWCISYIYIYFLIVTGHLQFNDRQAYEYNKHLKLTYGNYWNI